jgi:tyrosine-protein phosphatase YwqE
MKEIGIKFQIHVLSLNGFYGESAQRKGFEYIESGMVEYLGTDTHNMRYANALKETANNKSVQKIMKSHTFLNDKL